MNKPNNNERCMSTASSTVSGIYSNLLPSPDPVCMFYFANTHPFGGIATPSSTSYSIDPYAGMVPTAEKTPHSKHQNQPKNRCTQQHLNDFTPWPKQTWQSKDLLSPLVQALQKQIGQNINDFEKVLRTIRELWYTPQNNNSVTDVQYLHNYYSFIQRQKQLNEQNFDYILNWQGQLNPAPHCVHFMESNAFAANEMMMTHSNRSRIDKPLGGMGFITSNNTNTTATMFNKSKRPHTGLLRRRHSLPEIIMRKHQLASQKHVFSDMNATSAPSPPARERIPPSFESRERTRTSSSSSLGSSASTIVPNGFGSAGSTGSDSNLNRMFPTNGSMRQQLLRRLWHKEYRRLDRTGSLSPPLSRSLRTKRTLKLQETQPEVCLECQRLEVTHFNRSVPEIAMKHIKHTNSSISMTSSSASSLAFPRKSYSIETETLNDQSLMTISSASSTRKSSPPVQKSNITNSTATKELDITSAANMLNRMNGNFTTEDQMNGNDGSSQTNGDNSFFIEMEGDSINITTVARAESTAILDSTLCMSSNESSFRQHEQLTESTISQTSSQWFHESSGDGNNNNGDNDSIKSSKITEISHMKGPGGTYDAYHMSSGEIDIENESVVRLKTHEPLDQSTIDTIISQILVDSLNNIIVVQGKGNQSDSNGDSNNVELSISQTQIDNHTAMDECVSNPSSLPLPVTDQIYFPHYLSTETLSEYSMKLSDNSSATDLLPSNLVISVISGSTYPGDGGEMVVHRLTDMSRTESMEVQPSSAPSMHDDDDDENGNRIEDEANRPTKTATTVEEDDDDDDATSLVDSLDDPNAVANMSDLDAASNDVKMVEKSQAFFVPIEDSDTSCENVSTPADLNAAIADTMPDRLRERLQKRQMEIVERKEAEQKRRTEKIQKLISKHGTNRSSSDSKTNTSSFEVIPDESPKPLKKQIKVVAKKSKQLQSEIGSLESYTIDSQGNLKFVEAGKKSNGTKKVTTISGPAVKHIAIKKTITTSKPLVATKKPRESAASDKNPAEKRIKVTSNASSSRQRSKEIVSHRATRNVQKMTLGHHSPSDMITPDRDCGPRRMYQKTEIREGAKRIEILEIVECLNSSPDSLNPSQSSSSSPPTDSTPSQSLIERFSAKHTSKIPVPVLAKNKSRRTLLNGNQQRTLKAQIRDSVSHYNGSSMNNSKVDQIIADLLIEALNHSTDIGIEFIKTPQNASPQSHIKLNPAKRMSLSSRRASGLAIAGSSGSGGSGKRSSHSSAKYQQVFDSIPEEKSGSLSYDSSPNDEQNSTSPPVDRASSNNNSTGNPTSETESKTTTSTTTTAATKASSSPNKSNDTSRRATPPKFQSNGIQTKIASGKAAIESDQVKSETWFDCFGRAHVDSPVDGLLMEEGAPTTTAISSVATQDSALTSVPSEAPAREIQSVGSNSILPLIEETFETSATGNRGGDASKEKPFRKHARCSAQNHFDAPCSECESIENNLKEETSPIAKDKEISAAKLNGNELHLVAIKPSCHLPNGNENVWQMTHMDKYDTVGKFTLSPITVCSAQDTGTLTNNSSIKFGVDSSSFIVIHDENDNASHFLPNITSSEADQTPLRNGARPSKSQNQFERPCEDCCFCNPTLHHKRRTENSPKKCNFCSSRQQSTQTTPATSTRYQDKGQSVNDNNDAASAKSSSIPVERIYESKYRSNHTHIRTHSKESDTINTQCTKKTNKKVRKTLLNGSDDRLNANAEPNNRNKTEEPNGNEVNGNKATKHKSSIPKLPPATNEWTNNSMDSATSPNSSNSTGSSTKSNRRQDSKSVPNLPRADRSLQNIESSPNSKSQKTRTNSRYQNFYGNGTASATDERTAVTPNDPKSKPTGWTVTLAGTYSDDMAPDVQMHLSFPKRASSQGKKFDKSIHNHRSIEHAKDTNTETELDTNSNYNDTDSQKPDSKPALLPPPTPQSIKLNPKRSLTKNYLSTDLMHQQQQHSHLVLAPHRKFSFDSNGNANVYQRSTKDYCNLPHIRDHRLNHDHANRIVAKQTAKKTIKRSEYSVSVASATTTTRTISNFANGKRAMSIQALNANSFQRFHNGNRRGGPYGRRDHSADAGQLTYRLSATPSPLPSSSFYSPTTAGGYDDDTDRNGNHRNNLSVCGNAIAPERKPPVPTMSERDVTRRHDACFTRTRSIFL